MTVVSYLRLNEGTGMGCADTREMHGGRAYDISTKISEIPHVSGMISFAGAVPIGEEIRIRVNEFLDQQSEPEKLDFSAILTLIEDVYARVRDEVIYKGLFRRYGTNIEEWKKGELYTELRDTIQNNLKDPEGISVRLLVGGQDKKRGFRIHAVDYPGQSFSQKEYSTIGSGADRAELVIGDFLHNMPPEKRDNISLWRGAKTLLEATQAAWRNIGVGGPSQLVTLSNGEFYEFEREEITLMHNLLYLRNQHHIQEEQVNDAFKKLVEDRASSTQILEDIAKIDLDWSKLFLLGSSHF